MRDTELEGDTALVAKMAANLPAIGYDFNAMPLQQSGADDRFTARDCKYLLSAPRRAVTPTAHVPSKATLSTVKSVMIVRLVRCRTGSTKAVTALLRRPLRTVRA
jgi:hypothetical protein